MSRPGTGRTEHLVRLPGDEFSVWREGLLRGAGFPAAWVLEIADLDAASAAEHVFAAQAYADAEQERLVQMLEERAGATEGEAHHRVVKALRRVRKGRMPAPAQVDVSAWAAAREAAAHARRTFDECYADAHERVRPRLCKLIGDERFRRALAWQNRHALHHAIDKLLGATGIHDASTRKREALAAGYLQRYCTKNESIGFFGPMGWAAIDPGEASLALGHGDELIAAQHVYFEGWAIAALAARLGEDRRLRPWLRPRRLPLVGLHESAAYLPFSQKPIPLGAAEARLLAACDGTRTASRLAAELSGFPGLQSREEVFELIDRLCSKGLAVWKLEVPLDMRPERHLRECLNEIADKELRGASLARLDRLEGARDAVSKTADVRGLESALAQLDATFSEVADERATRLEGKIYAGRTLVYHEALRADRVTLGRAILDAAGPVLSLLMRSARWFTHEMARTYRKELVKLHQELAMQTGESEVPYLRLWLAAQALFLLRPSARAAAPAHLQELMDRLQERWGQVLGHPDAGARRIVYRCDELRPVVDEIFDAPGPGWSSARYSTPDLMIDAASADAVARGEFELVLGEFNMASHTFLNRTAIAHHPSPDALLAMLDRDHEEPLVCPIVPSDMYPYRVHPYVVNENGYELVWAPEMPGHERGKPLLAGELVVAPHGDGLVVRTRDGSTSLGILEVFGMAFSATCDHCFSLMPRGSHWPQIKFDRVVVQREGWRVPVAELAFAHVRDRAEQFLALRSWARARGIPRWFFVMAPSEEKPVYVDLDSPLFVDLLCKLIRGSSERDMDAHISVSEMLPAHGGMWLSDRHGNHYASELRLALVDPRLPGGAGSTT